MNILYRSKEAFSDGVSVKGNSWFEIIQKDVESSSVIGTKFDHIIPSSREEQLYREIFIDIFGTFNDHIVPYKWLPKWCGNITEPSARILSVY